MSSRWNRLAQEHISFNEVNAIYRPCNHVEAWLTKLIAAQTQPRPRLAEAAETRRAALRGMYRHAVGWLERSCNRRSGILRMKAAQTGS